MSLIAINGATAIDADTKDQIEFASLDLFFQILKRNNIKQSDIISMQISVTADITQYSPAAALKQNGCVVPLFTCLEPQFKDTPRFCIRYLVFAKGIAPCHVYLKGTEKN